MNGTLFDTKSVAQKIEEAKKLLEDNGYLVRGPLVKKSEIKTTADLVKFFYDMVAQYNPDLLMYYSSSKIRDLATAKAIIQSREAMGMSKERALLESCALVESLFKYEEYVGLSFKITSMSVLAQDWVVQKLTDIINGFNRQASYADDEAWFSKFYTEQENRIPDEITLRSNKRLGLEDEDGKKEE